MQPGDAVLLGAPETKEGVIDSGGEPSGVSMQTREARHNLGPEIGAEITAEIGAEIGVELGVVLMTKKPLELSTWLEYHHRALGIRRFYIQVYSQWPRLLGLFLLWLFLLWRHLLWLHLLWLGRGHAASRFAPLCAAVGQTGRVQLRQRDAA